MTSQAISTMPSAGVRYPAKSAPAPIPSIAAQESSATWRRRGSVKSFVSLCWLVGTSACFLTVGLVGMLAADLPPIHLKTLEDLVSAEELPMVETSMAELQSQEAAEEEASEEVAELPVEITEPVETPPEVQDLPELVEPMTQEDIFAIPSAPKIEDAMRPVDPVVKPKPRTPTPRPSPTNVVKRTGTGSPNATPGAIGGTAGGTGTARGSGKGKFPAPPYPSFARSGGMQGTVRLSISVGATGAVEGVNVVSSTGYSALDSYAVSWVRRNWRWGGGSANRYTLPLTFRLR